MKQNLKNNGTTLVGATVQIEVTITDVEGNFNLQANEGETLVFSFIGYQKQKVEITTTMFYICCYIQFNQIKK